MAKETHVAQATNFRGIVLSNRHLSFKNKQEGFEKLQWWLDALQQKHRLNRLIICMEPTGHYWTNLANWLARKGVNVVLVNPATTKRTLNDTLNILIGMVMQVLKAVLCFICVKGNKGQKTVELPHKRRR
jgi:transposase